MDAVILSSDKEYARALAANISEQNGLGIKVSLYTDPLKYNPQEVEDVFYILTEDDVDSWEEKIIKDKTLFLTGPGKKTKYENSISKFSSSDDITSKLMELVAETKGETKIYDKGRVLNKTSETKVIGFFSPVRRSYQTTLSMTLGNAISETNKVLYISFESFSPFWHFTGNSGKMKLEDLIMTVRESPEKFELFFNSIVHHDDSIDILPPVKSLHQILDIRARDWINLVNLVKTRCDYDVILLDLSESIHGLLELLRMCDRIYTVTQDDPCAIAKLNEYETLLRDCELEEISQKTIKKRIPYIEEIPNGFNYKPFSEFAAYVKDMIMGDGLYARLCMD